MKAAFHYIVKAKLIRQIKGKEPKFEEVIKVFENKNPIIARDDAFKHYQSWIDILLENKNKEYTSDKQARIDLASFMDHGKSIKLNAGENDIEFNNDTFSTGIGVFFVVDKPIDGNTPGNIWANESGEAILIHSIGIHDGNYMLDDILCFLDTEILFYKFYNYETNNNEEEIVFCFHSAWMDGCQDVAIGNHKILGTPFCWEGYGTPYWWGTEPEEQYSTDENEKFLDIILGGENNTVEFKSEFKSEAIAKSICAFLNSNGGILFIGITDSGLLQGLNFGDDVVKKASLKDSFHLNFDNMLADVLSFSFKSNIDGKFIELNGMDIFVVTISQSKYRPVFFEGKRFKNILYSWTWFN